MGTPNWSSITRVSTNKGDLVGKSKRLASCVVANLALSHPLAKVGWIPFLRNASWSEPEVKSSSKTL
jgi:hypothetical protein